MDKKTFWNFVLSPKAIILIVVVLIVLSAILGVVLKLNKKGNYFSSDTRNASYLVDGRKISLINGYAEIEVVSGSASKIITRYFGNEVSGGLDGDVFADKVFILTQETGGSGVFYYVAAALGEGKGGIVGLNAVFLGDRIAPQTTEIKNGLVVVNFADRRPDEPMTAQPSVGVTKYFKVIDNELKELELKLSEGEARTIAEQNCIKGGESLAGDGSYNENSRTWWFDANLNSTQKGCRPACVVSEDKNAEINWRCTGLMPDSSLLVSALPSGQTSKAETKLPKTLSPGEKIISAQYTKDCRVKVVSNVKEYDFSIESYARQCEPKPLVVISPSGRFLAYDGTRGGVDSLMALFSIEYGKSLTLGVWGTSSIIDYTFLSDDRLVVINGYPDNFDEQWLVLFDLPKIFENLSENFDSESFSLRVSNPLFEVVKSLPNVGEAHTKLSSAGDYLQTKTASGDLLFQTRIEDILMSAGHFAVTPKLALSFAYYEDKKNINPVDSPIIKMVFNSEKSTNDYWWVDVFNTKTQTILRSYKVDQRTAQATRVF